ncbi:efflux RND transporter permease subunit [Acidomonas methanolica]|uniref:efflux RND transporter permease subunit n=1 Tax=Acidomonas methanolica TaxID=437 RepID=UPI00211A1B23|nr:efflux RND transporter permease subunit [Acidomonas methanolica]MCQ9156788.1 efflux RND transporter permease subunit [Acidomonas methanolica]
MRVTDIFIRRPVLSLVVCAAILVSGLRIGMSLPIQQFPQTVSASISVSTTYYGANAATMAGFVTTPIESAVSAVGGIDYISSQSQTSSSTVTVHLRLNVDPKPIMGQVMAYVSAIMNKLPAGTQQPIITLNNNASGTMYIAVASKTLRPEQVSDYVSRIVIPQLQAVPGVQRAFNQADFTMALRIWFDAKRLAGYGLTALDAAAALEENDYVTGVGTTQGGMTYANLAITTSLHDVDQFRNLILARRGSALVRLGDVARVDYGSETTTVSLKDSLGQGAFIEIDLQPEANMLNANAALRQVFSRIAARLPPGMGAQIVYDRSSFVNASLHEVELTLIEAILIVASVIFLFLGSVRAALIPLVTIPVSLVGTLALMGIMGFSINVLTLLALVLAIGLVVDDAIIVVEDVNRHLADGRKPLDAALLAARELTGPIIAMTAVLVAAYVPIGLQKGLTGALFTEFAFTLAASVIVSAILAVTLSPMMCGHMLRPHGGQASRFVHLSDTALHAMQRLYGGALRRTLTVWPLVVLAAIGIIAVNIWLLTHLTSELAPQEDQGLVLIAGQAPPNTTMDMIARYDDEVSQIYHEVPEAKNYWLVDLPNMQIGGLALQPWGKRTRTATQIQAALQARLQTIAGIQLAAYQSPPLPGSHGMPIQFVLKTAGSTDDLATVSKEFLAKARRSGFFAYINNDLKIDQPQVTIMLDRDKISELGLTANSIGDTLNEMLGGSYINYFPRDRRSYRVMTLVTRSQRLNAEQILDYPVAFIPQQNSPSIPIPLSEVATLTRQIVPQQIAHFQQLNATTFSAIPAPGVSTGQAFRYLKTMANDMLPGSYATDAAGPLRDYIRDHGTFLPSFGFGVVIIYLALAALFGSFRDPLVILISVPMSIGGAMLFLWLGVGGSTLNIYSEIGLVSLAGLISKHGILIVEVANETQHHGLEKREAIIHAARTRLRPILMTSAAMVLGVSPLLAATGAGAGSRFVMGLVLASGLSIGTVFTLFAVPAFYMLLGAPDKSANVNGMP